MTPDASAHALRRAGLYAAIRSSAAGGGAKRRLDLSGFCHVFDVNTPRRWVDVEGLTTHDDPVAKTLAHGGMPTSTRTCSSVDRIYMAR